MALGLDDGLPRLTVQQSEQFRGVTYPVGVGDRVIVQSAWCQNNVVAALDAATGEMLWRTDPSLPVIEINPSRAAIIDDAVYSAMTTTGTPESVSVTGIDTSDGHVVWTTRVPRRITDSCSPSRDRSSPGGSPNAARVGARSWRRLDAVVDPPSASR